MLLNLGKTVRFLMKQKGLTQIAVCRATGIDQSLLSRIIAGRVRLMPANAVVLGKALDVNPRWLMMIAIDADLYEAGYRPRMPQRGKRYWITPAS